MTYQSQKLEKFSSFQSTLQDKLVNWDCEKESLQCQNENKRLTCFKRPTNCSCIYESEEISCLLTVKKGCVSIWLPDKTKIKKQKWLLLSDISVIYAQFKKENPDRKTGFSMFALLHPKWCIPVGAEGTHNVCICNYHQNLKLMMVAMDSSSIYRQIMKLCVCDVEKYDCMTGHCDNCPNLIFEKWVVKNNWSRSDNSVQPMGQHW